MAKETSNFRSVDSSGEELRKVTVDIPDLGIEDMSSGWVEAQEEKAKTEAKMEERAKLAEKVEKRKEAMTKKARARKRLEEEGASKEALFAFEMAYDKRFWDSMGKLREMKAAKKDNKRLSKENWKTVHTAMMENEKYQDVYKAVTPLIKPGEPVPEENKKPEVVASTTIPLIDLVTGKEIKPAVAEGVTEDIEKTERFGLEPDEQIALTEALSIMHPDMHEDWNNLDDKLLETNIRFYIDHHKERGRDMRGSDEWIASIEEADNPGYGQTVDVAAIKAEKLDPRNRLAYDLGISESLASNVISVLDRVKKSPVDSRYALDLNNPADRNRLKKIIDIHQKSKLSLIQESLFILFGKAVEEAKKEGLNEEAAQNLVAALFLGDKGFNVNRSKDSGLMANLIKKAPDGTSSQEAWAGLIEGKMDDSVRVTSVSTRKSR